MSRAMLKTLAMSGFVLAVSTGCTTMGSKSASISSAPHGGAQGSASAGKALAALEKGKVSKAVALAEAAVEASPRDPSHRALLGQAYLADGRFVSAESALGEAVELGANDPNTIIALALAKIAQGKLRNAVTLLGEHRDQLPPADTGLALALAGDTDAAIYVLTEAARAPGATARTRQNLALALALSGRWAQARILAAQDLSLAKVEARMVEWSKLAEQADSQVRVASLIGTEPRADAGMPVRLALQSGSSLSTEGKPHGVALASADPAPLASYAPPPPVTVAGAVPARLAAHVEAPAAAPLHASAPAAIRSVELPMPQRDANGFVELDELPVPAAPQIIAAEATPYRAAPRVAGEASERVRPAQRQALVLATRIIPKALGFDAKNPSGWAVQLGAYDSLAIAREKWNLLKKRNSELAPFPASSHAAVVSGRTFYRLTVNGLGSRNDARKLCQQLKADGHACFVREMGGNEEIQWAAKARPVELASR